VRDLDSAYAILAVLGLPNVLEQGQSRGGRNDDHTVDMCVNPRFDFVRRSYTRPDLDALGW
jgi:hypothetical protein